MGEKETLQEIVRLATVRLIEINKGEQTAFTLGPEVQESIKSLRWTDKGDFSWAFAKTREGGLLPNAVPLLDAIHGAEGRLMLNGELFTVSQDGKFLNRKVPRK